MATSSATTKAAKATPIDPANLDPTREARARRIIRGCDGRGWQITPEGGLEVLPTHRGLAARGLVEEPSAAHRAELAEFLAEVLALRFPGSRPRPVRARSRGPMVRRVEPAMRKRTRAILAALVGHPDPWSGVRQAARTLCEALGDHRSRTIEAFEGIAQEIAGGHLLAGDVVGAFDRACGPRVRDRAAFLVGEVGKLKGDRAGLGGRSVPRSRGPGG